MSAETSAFFIALLQIIWINALLSGDNAVVIALACRSLDPKSRRWGVILGAGVAVAMRILFTLIVTTLMALPYLKVVGGLLLFWIAIQLLVENSDEKEIAASTSVWSAVRTIAIADTVMSLDNVVAIAAAANGNWVLIILGLAISIPMIIFGATLIMTALERYPILVWAGAALLGWVAGELIVADPAFQPLLNGATPESIEEMTGTAGAIIVVAAGYLLRRRSEASNEDVDTSG
jgi:YjbE family integral membrane protein